VVTRRVGEVRRRHEAVPSLADRTPSVAGGYRRTRRDDCDRRLLGINRFVDAPWYDARRESGAVLEVKSALSTLGSGADGRFRLWREQHEKLVEHDRDGSARYGFVLFDVSGREPTALLKQREPATVGRQIGARGGWGPSGHDSQGEQHKLPIEAIFEDYDS
jgi:hypothetical protein